MDNREKDIQTVCRAILWAQPEITGDYGSGAMCPFCSTPCNWDADDMLKIEHKLDCPVLVAKDLSTNF